MCVQVGVATCRAKDIGQAEGKVYKYLYNVCTGGFDYLSGAGGVWHTGRSNSEVY